MNGCSSNIQLIFYSHTTARKIYIRKALQWMKTSSLIDQYTKHTHVPYAKLQCHVLTASS